MHSIGYIIESDENIRVEYVQEENEPYFQPEWVEDVNAFNDITDVDPYDTESPEMVRIGQNEPFSYYTKTLICEWPMTKFRICVAIDGVEGNTSFRYDGYNSFIRTRRESSDIYVTLDKNKTEEDRYGVITITHNSEPETVCNVRIKQEKCNIGLSFLSCTIEDGTNDAYEMPIHTDSFEYTFEKLTDVQTPKKQSLSFSILPTGITNRFYVKNISKYAVIGEIDDTYTFSGGKYYKDMPKMSNGEYVTKRVEVKVLDNIAYNPAEYDGAFEISIKDNNTLLVTNYGRVYMEDDAIYVITLANYDNIKYTLEILMKYA